MTEHTPIKMKRKINEYERAAAGLTGALTFTVPRSGNIRRNTRLQMQRPQCCGPMPPKYSDID
ncbi:hypothetical protein [Pseudomonas graminis]|uniref:hypothetical protein n=1 Tax=Pseudomonas graminis TaxID=158627 RepID=UPI00105C1659|nr:hypothetical protein [Pseudomonas graminis]